MPGAFEKDYDRMDDIKTNWGGTFDCVTPEAFATARIIHERITLDETIQTRRRVTKRAL